MRKEYGDMGCNAEGRVGTHFLEGNGLNTLTATDKTFAGEIISLTRIY